MDISLKTFCIICGLYVVAIVGILIWMQLKAAENSAQLTARVEQAEKRLSALIDEAEKRHSAALGEWTSAMSDHITASIAAIGDTTAKLQERSLKANEAICDQYKVSTQAAAEKNTTALKLATERYEHLTNVIVKAVNSLEGRIAKEEQANHELNATLQQLKKTLEEAVKL